MQEHTTRRAQLRADLEERLAATAKVHWPLDRMLPGVRAIPQIEEEAPRALLAAERKKWADEQRKADEESALARIDGLVRLDSEASVRFERGKLSFLIDEQEVARVFLAEQEAPLVEAQWRCVALDLQSSGKGDAKRLVDRLRRVATVADPALAAQIITIGDALAELTAVLRDDEEQLHELTCHLFNLTAEERSLVESGVR
jgi:hypothetical protein